MFCCKDEFGKTFMKWPYTFLIGAMVGALGLLLYLRSTSPDQVSVTSPFSVGVARPTAGVVFAGVVSATQSAIKTPPSYLRAAPAPIARGAGSVADPLLIPVADIHASQLHDTFNEARGSVRRHEAIDILALRGTQVFAVADGKVAKLFDSKPGGLTIYQFDASEKFAYYYAHLDRYAPEVKEGIFLHRGDVIGYVGTTGNADPATPHLHFAIFELGPEKQWWKGNAINPYPLLGGVTRP